MKKCIALVLLYIVSSVSMQGLVAMQDVQKGVETRGMKRKRAGQQSRLKQPIVSEKQPPKTVTFEEGRKVIYFFGKKAILGNKKVWREDVAERREHWDYLCDHEEEWRSERLLEAAKDNQARHKKARLEQEKNQRVEKEAPGPVECINVIH